MPKPCKIRDWLLDSFCFGLHQGKNVKVTMGFEVPKRYILRPTLFMHTVQQVLWWERQKRRFGEIRQGPMVEKWCCNDFLMVFLRSEEKRRQEMVNFDLIWFDFSKLPLLDICYKKIKPFTFWCMVIPLGPHLVYTYWRAQRLCIYFFLKYRTMDHEMSPWKKTIFHGRTSWSMV